MRLFRTLQEFAALATAIWQEKDRRVRCPVSRRIPTDLFKHLVRLSVCRVRQLGLIVYVDKILNMQY